MSQEYTEDKEVSLKPLSSRRCLLEALLILVSLFAIYLMVSLVSFNPSDPSWSQTAWYEPIHNLGGGMGAWLADTLLFIFGVMAYAIPPVIIGLCWIAFRQRDWHDYIDYFAIGLRLIGVLALVVTTCGLAALNADDIWYFASGGVIGSLVSSDIAPWFSPATGTLVLLFVWAAGITLYTGWSWLTIAERIGSIVMGVLTFASNRSRRDEPWREEDEDEYEDAPRVVTQDEYDVLLSSPQAADPLLAKAAAAPDAALTSAVEAASAVTSTPQPSASVFTPAATQPQPATPAEPPRYHFEMPQKQPAPAFSQWEEDDGPQMGNWRDADMSVAAVAAQTATTPLFDIAPEGDYNPQVKQGIGPALPRPNPVKLPTRRELASYGIKLPSQRMVEEKKAKAEDQQRADAALEWQEEDARIGRSSATAKPSRKRRRPHLAWIPPPRSTSRRQKI